MDRVLQHEHRPRVREIRHRDIQDQVGNPSQVQTAVQLQLGLGHQARAERLTVMAGHDLRIIGHPCLGFPQAAAQSRHANSDDMYHHGAPQVEQENR
jgi:hypothetical protein